MQRGHSGMDPHMELMHAPPFLHRITVGAQLIQKDDSASILSKCRCCSDTGVYTERTPGDTHGRLEFCQFCTGIPVLLYGGRYRVVKGVGQGAFSTVWLAQDLYTPDLAPVALKIFHEQYHDIGLAEFECLKEALKADRTNAFGMLQCAHAFVHCKHHFVLVMEPLQACDVFDPSNSDSADGKCPRHIVQLIQNISLSLNLLHIRLGRIHADLKPENILISRHERRFRLIDYGSTVPKSQASVYETKEAGFELVSWMYRAPELLIGLSGGVAPAIDIWSLGCLAFEALVGRSLCQSTDRMQFLKSLSEILGPLPEVYKTGQYFTSALSTCLSSAYENGSDKNYWRRWRAANLRSILNIKDTVFLDLMSRLLDPDPSNRISVEEIIRHPFVSPMTPFFDKPMHDLPIVHAPLEFCMSPSKENQRPENKAMKKAPAPRKKKQEETIPSPIASEQSVSETTKVSVPTLKKAATSKAAKEAVSRAPARKPDAPTSSVSPLEIEFTQLPSTETIPKDPVLKAMTRRVPQVTGKRRTRV